MIKVHLCLSTFGMALISLSFYYHSLWLLIGLGLTNGLYLAYMTFKMPSPGVTIEKMYLFIIFSSVILDIGVAYQKELLAWSGSLMMSLMLLLILLEPLPKRFRKDRHGRTTTDQL